jgi:hypothetical protein
MASRVASQASPEKSGVEPPQSKLPGFDASLRGERTGFETTGFRRLENRRQNSENRNQMEGKTEASGTGSWQKEKINYERRERRRKGREILTADVADGHR